MNIKRNLTYPIIGLLAVLVCGTLGYVILEEWSVSDSLYMTVITLSTVGFTEVHELSLAGRYFTICLIISGIGKEVCASGHPVQPPACLFFGGETTVTLKGDGKGGRNQELALAAALALDGQARISLLSAGSDGTDGPTDAAGAIIDGSTCAAAARMGLDAYAFLERNDAYAFFDKMGLLIKTGPTRTNVMDMVCVMAGAE